VTARRLTLAGFLILAFVVMLRPVGPQQVRVYRIGVVLQGGAYFTALDGLRDGLREMGFEEGKQFLLVASFRKPGGDSPAFTGSSPISQQSVSSF
jgi:hypothetical protein